MSGVVSLLIIYILKNLKYIEKKVVVTLQTMKWNLLVTDFYAQYVLKYFKSGPFSLFSSRDNCRVFVQPFLWQIPYVQPCTELPNIAESLKTRGRKALDVALTKHWNEQDTPLAFALAPDLISHLALAEFHSHSRDLQFASKIGMVHSGFPTEQQGEEKRLLPLRHDTVYWL